MAGRQPDGGVILNPSATAELMAIIHRPIEHHRHQWCQLADHKCGGCLICGELVAAKQLGAAEYFAEFGEHEDDVCTACGAPAPPAD
jgi:hypothetical protein